jgi:hypothetical protein
MADSVRSKPLLSAAVLLKREKAMSDSEEELERRCRFVSEKMESYGIKLLTWKEFSARNKAAIAKIDRAISDFESKPSPK